MIRLNYLYSYLKVREIVYVLSFHILLDFLAPFAASLDFVK